MESILIIDDEKENLQALHRLLRGEFEVTTIESGLEALKTIRDKEFAVVVSDQRMPEITGVDLLEKAKDVRPRMVRILLTGYTEIESVIAAINRGSVYRYIAKPWDPSEFKITVRQAAESYRLRADLDAKTEALVHSHQRLERALVELRTLDQAKARFLSLVSHELNTPLTAMTAFIGLLAERAPQLPTDVQRSVASLTGAAHRLSEIISDVLNFVRLEAAGPGAEADFKWSGEVLSIIAELEPARAKKQIEFAVQGNQELVTRAAADQLRVAVSKLVHEAVMRAQDNTQVKVYFGHKPQGMTFQILWKGTTLPEQAFEAFETGGSLQHHHRNLALGLAIARRALEAQGATLHSVPSDESGWVGLVVRWPAPRVSSESV